MKRSKKITAVLIAAMVMTVAMVVVAYAEYVYVPAWNEGTGRYTQVYEMSVGVNWRYTTQITKVLGDTSKSIYVEKKFPERDCLVQCTYNALTAFPSYYQVYASDAFPLTTEMSMTGTGTNTLDFPYPSNADELMCLGIRHDPRDSSSRINRGNWSPDTF